MQRLFALCDTVEVPPAVFHLTAHHVRTLLLQSKVDVAVMLNLVHIATEEESLEYLIQELYGIPGVEREERHNAMLARIVGPLLLETRYDKLLERCPSPRGGHLAMLRGSELLESNAETATRHVLESLALRKRAPERRTPRLV